MKQRTPRADLQIFPGGAVKVSGNTITGPGVIFSDENSPDLTNEFFTAETAFWLEDRISFPLMYAHAQDPTIGTLRLGTAHFKQDAAAIWFTAEVAKRDEYVEKILELIRRGMLGFSTGALGHLTEKKKTAAGSWFLKVWPIFEISLTPCPAEPRTLAQLKDYHPTPFKELRNSTFPLEKERAQFEKLQRAANARQTGDLVAERERFSQLLARSTSRWQDTQIEKSRVYRSGSEVRRIQTARGFEKMGARNSGADIARLQTIHDELTALEPSVCDAAARGLRRAS